MEPAEVRISVRPDAGRALLVVNVVVVTVFAVVLVVTAVAQVRDGELPVLAPLFGAYLVWSSRSAVRAFREERERDPLRLVIGPVGIVRPGGSTIPWSQVDTVRYRSPRPPASWFGRSGSVAVVQESQTRFAARAGVRPEATRISASQLDHSAAQIMDAITLYAPEPLRARLPAPWGTGEGSSPHSTRSSR